MSELNRFQDLGVNYHIFPLIRRLPLSKEAEKIANEGDFELAGYKFTAAKEQLRSPRIVCCGRGESDRKKRLRYPLFQVRLGLVQNKIVLPTTAPLDAQRDAILKRVGTICEAAAHCGVNIICFQEAWSEGEHPNSTKSHGFINVFNLQTCRLPFALVRNSLGANLPSRLKTGRQRSSARR